ncbi:hypothetical protein BDA99DRAFT_533676 [Phascolomyces articulosus]|uniref:Uncharacterized protein n=1 Tax=Phascolomyces articulosus TaxID=60185 RepID=A0AAD5KPB7_9FUNG|nr:hypothetical protein BDA99DRAFT_533676 [Phascolomyces articulosus]
MLFCVLSIFHGSTLFNPILCSRYTGNINLQIQHSNLKSAALELPVDTHQYQRQKQAMISSSSNQYKAINIPNDNLGRRSNTAIPAKTFYRKPAIQAQIYPQLGYTPIRIPLRHIHHHQNILWTQ